MRRLYQAALLLLLSVCLVQCQKELSYFGSPDSGGTNLPDPIKTTLQGNIVDENDQPAPGVTITAGNQTAITDASGYFRIADAILDKNSSLVTATKPGYFKGIRTFAATSGANQVFIKLLKKDLAGSVSAATGGAATLANGAKVSLPANGVVVASTKALYTGDIKIYATYINPKSGDISKTIPGSFAGVDKDGKRVSLHSYGMLAVELESSAGEKLQIRDGAVATLTTPIAGAAAGAPATIPMWYVDETTGLWKEDGSATKQGNNYVGDVPHFSFWNCDYPFEAATLSVTLHNSGDEPLVYAKVRVSAMLNSDSASVAFGYTDSLGRVSGLVPANQNLTVTVLDPCDQPIYAQPVTPLAVKSAKDLGVLKLAASTPNLLTITGTLKDCSGSAVTNGYAIINVGNWVRYAKTNQDGGYTVNIVVCGSTFTSATILGVDEGNKQQGATATIPITLPVTNVAAQTACGVSSAQFFNYTIDGTQYSLTTDNNDSLTVVLSQSNVYISANRFENGVLTGMSFSVDNVAGEGTYPIASIGRLHTYNIAAPANPLNVTFTALGSSVGEFVEGSVDGKFTADNLPAEHTISGTFKIRRVN